MRKSSHLRGLSLWTLTLILACSGASYAAETVALSKKGAALLPIRLSPKATPAVRQSAADLARLLKAMSGADFTVEAQPAPAKAAIVLGLASDFPEVAKDVAWDLKNPIGREQYLMRTSGGSLLLLGATDAAVDYAAWDLLYRLGYRRYFPNEAWEIIPPARDLTLAIDVVEKPDYATRVIWYGWGLWDYNKTAYRAWQRANRAPGRFRLSSGHAYHKIMRRNKAAFKEHPEYLGLWKGERTSTKFCIANPELRKLVADYAVKEITRRPGTDSVSIEPSDGGRWCECEGCAAIGSISDRAVTLANVGAEALTAKVGEKYVGMYAYNQHSPPPTKVRVAPNVVISVATRFIRGGYTLEQLLDGWGKAGGKALGIREYFSSGGRDLPGQQLASNLGYLARVIPYYHSKGARFLTSEAADNWGPCGLGYYTATRMLWDIDEAKRVDHHLNEFVTTCFGKAAKPMHEFYTRLNGSDRPLLSDDLVGRMYRLLAEARSLTKDPAVHKRIDQLTLYTYYAECFRSYRNVRGAPRQKAFEKLIRTAYRMRTTMMVHVKGLYRDLPNRDRTVKVPKGCDWRTPAAKNPWKSDPAFTEAEIETMRKKGIAKHKLFDFTPVSFSSNLVPATNLKGVKKPTAMANGVTARGHRTFYLWVDKAPMDIKLTVTAGMIKHYRDRGPAKVSLYALADPTGNMTAKGSSLPDGKPRTVTLKTTFSGLHRLEVIDGSDMTRINWPKGLRVVADNSPDKKLRLAGGRWTLYFYVPTGCKEVAGYAAAKGGAIETPDGKAAHKFDGKKGFFRIPVAAGQDGKVWRINHVGGKVTLMTTPPFLARSAEELLLPHDLVEKR
jgi:Domain of unknown function (DUF4838)